MLGDDLAEIVADLPASLVYKGATVTGTMSALSDSFDLGLPGTEREATHEWTGAYEDFADVPDTNSVVEIDGDTWRVVSRQIDPAEVAITLSIRRM